MIGAQKPKKKVCHSTAKLGKDLNSTIIGLLQGALQPSLDLAFYPCNIDGKRHECPSIQYRWSAGEIKGPNRPREGPKQGGRYA